MTQSSPPSNASDEAKRLVEDPDERAYFDKTVTNIFGGSPLRAVAASLTIWAKSFPEYGSLSKSCAVYANEIASAATYIADLEARAAQQQEKRS